MRSLVSSFAQNSRILSPSRHVIKISYQPFSVSNDHDSQQEKSLGFRQKMKIMFKKYFFPASVIYGTSYLSLLGVVYLGISFNVGTVVGLDYPTLLHQVISI
jgi:hypothetical protein